MLQFPTTITAGGTTGNQTIDKLTGTVNIAAAGTSVTVTNALVTTSSIVFAVIHERHDGGYQERRPVIGSFVITLNAAATAEVSIGFIVFNLIGCTQMPALPNRAFDVRNLNNAVDADAMPYPRATGIVFKDNASKDMVIDVVRESELRCA